MKGSLYEEEFMNTLKSIHLARSLEKRSIIVKISTKFLEDFTKELKEDGYTVYVNLVCYLDDRSSVTISWE